MTTTDLYREESSAGNVYRSSYHDGLEALLKQLQKQADCERTSLHPEIMENPDAFRDRIRRHLGWPLTDSRRKGATVKKIYVASDSQADIYRLQLEIQPGIWMYGILFLQHTDVPCPLVIVQHGGFGTPELCSSFVDSGNYNDMTRRILKKGVHVFCPQLFLWHSQLFGDRPYDRRQFDDALKRVGSSITAIELDGLQQCLDYLQTLPQVLPERIGMVGLSYGGFYTLLFGALDIRIRAAMTACFFNDADAHREFSDCAWFGSRRVFQDAELAALICPRTLWISVANRDELFSCETAEKEMNRLREICGERWKNLCIQVFEGVHEFPKDDAGVDFVVQALV